MVNYLDSIIYKIVCNDTEITDVYVGSTKDFKQRSSQHKHDCNNMNSKHYNLPVYRCIRDNGGWDNWSIIEIEIYSCKTKKELLAQEAYHVRSIGTINSHIPGRTKAQWYEDNREHVRVVIKAYHLKNKEQIKVYKQAYRLKNKEQIKVYKQAYRLKNKEKITCVCGSIVGKCNMKMHNKTKKHLKFMEHPLEHP